MGTPGGLGRRARQQYQGAGTRLFVPSLDFMDGVSITDQHRVNPFAEQTLGQRGLLPVGADVVAERAQDGVVELVAHGHE